MVITLLIIVLTAIISINGFRNPAAVSKFQFNPFQVYHRKEWYRMITHGFFHADWTHLIVNMMTLYFFGGVVEHVFHNRLLYILFYLSAIIASSLITLFKHKENYYYNAIGASGGVSAIVFASILFAPWSRIIVFPIPIPIPALIYGILFLGYSQYMSRRNADHINHDAHFAGAVYGFVLPILFNHLYFQWFIAQVFHH